MCLNPDHQAPELILFIHSLYGCPVLPYSRGLNQNLCGGDGVGRELEGWEEEGEA